MSAVRQTAVAVRQTAVDRKSIARVGVDMQLEEGIVPIGALMHITTVQFAYRGILKAVTASWYLLEEAVEGQGVANVFNTGDLRNYFKNKRGSEEEPWSARVFVERTSVTALWGWP